MPKNIALKTIEIKWLKQIFVSIPSIQKVMVFGSRVRGDNRAYSDLDVLISGLISSADRAKLAELLEDSSLPFTVDIAVESQLQPDFLVAIKKEYKLLYSKK